MKVLFFQVALPVDERRDPEEVARFVAEAVDKYQGSPLTARPEVQALPGSVALYIRASKEHYLKVEELHTVFMQLEKTRPTPPELQERYDNLRGLVLQLEREKKAAFLHLLDD